VNQANRSFPELAVLTHRFTMRTRSRLARALVRALRSHAHEFRGPLHDAVREASRELRAEGLDDRAILTFFGGLVEDTGRACGADRPSLMSGEVRWVPVRDRVLEFARSALGSTVHASAESAG
jgi:uncharacterized protein YbjT (DUF2867 family)